MRVIAGRLGGQKFASPQGPRTHPMSERVRGGLFNQLGDIEGLTVLDAFAGSGALALEAASRGASSVIAVDMDKKAANAINNNIQALGLQDSIKAIQANCSAWSDNNPDAIFDLVFADPPYDNLQLSILQKLARHNVGGGLYILAWPGKLEVPEFIGLSRIKQSNYGDSQLVFYRKSA